MYACSFPVDFQRSTQGSKGHPPGLSSRRGKMEALDKGWATWILGEVAVSFPRGKHNCFLVAVGDGMGDGGGGRR